MVHPMTDCQGMVLEVETKPEKRVVSLMQNKKSVVTLEIGKVLVKVKLQ